MHSPADPSSRYWSTVGPHRDTRTDLLPHTVPPSAQVLTDGDGGRFWRPAPTWTASSKQSSTWQTAPRPVVAVANGSRSHSTNGTCGDMAAWQANPARTDSVESTAADRGRPPADRRRRHRWAVDCSAPSCRPGRGRLHGTAGERHRPDPNRIASCHENLRRSRWTAAVSHWCCRPRRGPCSAYTTERAACSDVSERPFHSGRPEPTTE